jgi:hypothetical protein
MPKPKRARTQRRVSYKRRCAELEEEIESLRNTAATEQAARVAIEQVDGGQLEEIQRLLKARA